MGKFELWGYEWAIEYRCLLKCMDRRESRVHKFVKLFKYVNVCIEKYVYVYVNIVILNPISG